MWFKFKGKAAWGTTAKAILAVICREGQVLLILILDQVQDILN